MANWKKSMPDKWTILWTKGKFITGKGYSDWIHVQKTSLTKEWEVGAKRKINQKTLNGHFRFFKSKIPAMNLAKDYRKKY